MCKCLWGTSAKRTGVCFLLGIDTFAVVHVDEIRKNRSYTRLDSQIANVYGKWENGKIWKNSKSCRQDLETLHLASKIWKILNLVGKICKILNLLGKICKKIQKRAGKIWKIQEHLENSKSFLQDSENSRSCRQDLEFSIFGYSPLANSPQ